MQKIDTPLPPPPPPLSNYKRVTVFFPLDDVFFLARAGDIFVMPCTGVDGNDITEKTRLRYLQYAARAGLDIKSKSYKLPEPWLKITYLGKKDRKINLYPVLSKIKKLDEKIGFLDVISVKEIRTFLGYSPRDNIPADVYSALVDKMTSLGFVKKLSRYMGGVPVNVWMRDV